MNKTIQLQCIGTTKAKPAEEFKVGEFFVWNFGFHSEIVGIKKVTKHQIIFLIQSEDGKIYERILTKKRLVGIGSQTAFKINKGDLSINDYIEMKKKGVVFQ